MKLFITCRCLMRRNRGVHPYPQTEQKKNHLRKRIREKSVHKGNSSASGAVEIRYMYMNICYFILRTCPVDHVTICIIPKA